MFTIRDASGHVNTNRLLKNALFACLDPLSFCFNPLWILVFYFYSNGGGNGNAESR